MRPYILIEWNDTKTEAKGWYVYLIWQKDIPAGESGCIPL